MASTVAPRGPGVVDIASSVNHDSATGTSRAAEPASGNSPVAGGSSIKTTAQNANPLARKLQRILGGSANLDDSSQSSGCLAVTSGTGTRNGPLSAEVLGALEGLGDFFAENSLAARRNLRGDLERHGLKVNEQFIKAFSSVQEVCILNSGVNSLNRCSVYVAHICVCAISPYLSET